MAKTKDGTGTNQATEKGIRVVYVGVQSPPDANRSLSASVHPKLYDTFVERVGALKGTGELNGQKILQDGAMALAIREAIATYSDYQYQNAGDLVLTKSRESNKTQESRKLVKTMFAGLRSKLDFESSVGVARGMLAMMGVTVTEQEFADLWDEAAA